MLKGVGHDATNMFVGELIDHFPALASALHESKVAQHAQVL